MQRRLPDSNKENLYPRRATLSGHETAPSQPTLTSACNQNSSGNRVAGNYEQPHQLQPPGPRLNGPASNASSTQQSEDSMLGVPHQPLSQVLNASQLQSSSRSQPKRVQVHFNGFQYRPDPSYRTGLQLRRLPGPSSSALGMNKPPDQVTPPSAASESPIIANKDSNNSHAGSGTNRPHSSHNVESGGDADDQNERSNDDRSAAVAGSANDDIDDNQADQESTTWAMRNPGKSVQAPRQYRASNRQMTDAEKISSKMRTGRLQDDAKLLNEAIADVQSYCRDKSEEIAKRFGRKPDHIHRLIHSASNFKQSRTPNLFNALVHKKAKEINSDASPGQRMPLSGIQQLVLDDLEESHPTEEEAQTAVQELQEHRNLKTKGARGTNLAAAQDLKNTLMRLDVEVNNLYERTGSYAFVMVTRGHVHDIGIPGWAASPDASLFIREVLKMDIWDMLKKFELWAVTKDTRPNIDTLLSMRTECALLIAEGLRAITKNKKIIMNYVNYEGSIVQKYHVKLDGWPASIAFATPHNISTMDEIRLLRHHLLEKTCKWVKLNQAEVKKHMETYAAKVKEGIIVGRKRKVRSDKGKRRKKRAVQDDEEIEGEEVQIEDEDQDGDDGPRRSRRITKRKYKSNAFVDDEAAEDESVGSSDEYDDDI